MTLDCNKYRINLPFIETLTKDKTNEERIKLAGSLAVASGVPIIVVACYLGELWGFTEELKGFISRLKVFYTIELILNAKGGVEV